MEVTGAAEETTFVDKEKEIVIMMGNVSLDWNVILMDGGEEIIAQPVCLDFSVESNSIYYGFNGIISSAFWFLKGSKNYLVNIFSN